MPSELGEHDVHDVITLPDGQLLPIGGLLQHGVIFSDVVHHILLQDFSLADALRQREKAEVVVLSNGDGQSDLAQLQESWDVEVVCQFEKVGIDVSTDRVRIEEFQHFFHRVRSDFEAVTVDSVLLSLQSGFKDGSKKRGPGLDDVLVAGELLILAEEREVGVIGVLEEAEQVTLKWRLFVVVDHDGCTVSEDAVDISFQIKGHPAKVAIFARPKNQVVRRVVSGEPDVHFGPVDQSASSPLFPDLESVGEAEFVVPDDEVFHWGFFYVSSRLGVNPIFEVGDGPGPIADEGGKARLQALGRTLHNLILIGGRKKFSPQQFERLLGEADK